MELCEASHRALREEARRAGISVEALMEWIELCGAKAQLEEEMKRVERALDRHHQQHPRRARPALRLVE